MLKKKIISMLLLCFTLVSMTGCVINGEEKEDKEKYATAKRTIVVNWTTADVTLENVRFYDFKKKRRLTGVNGKGHVISGIDNGFGEITLDKQGHLYILRGELARNKVKMQHKKTGECDTYKKK